MQVKITMWYKNVFSRMTKRLIILSVGEGVDQLEPLYTGDGYVKWYYHFGKWSGSFLQRETVIILPDHSTPR